MSFPDLTPLVDFHTHILSTWGRPPFTEEALFEKMDNLQIGKFVLLPILGPEGPYFPFTTEDVLKVYRKNPERVIPFCNIDPRAGNNSPQTDFMPLLDGYKKAGCRGLGEVTANIYVDSPLCVNLFKQCGIKGLPVLFHLYSRLGGSYGLVDERGLPRLEKVLGMCHDTYFVGHATAFWSEISSDVDEETRGGYPEGPVKAPGKLQKLFSDYPNIYGDLSAASGYNAITRDRDYGYRFMEEYQDRLLFGTDACQVNQDIRIVNYLNEALEGGMISEKAYKKITVTNAVKLLRLN